jgi:hypothetical protein
MITKHIAGVVTPTIQRFAGVDIFATNLWSQIPGIVGIAAMIASEHAFNAGYAVERKVFGQ